MYIYIYIYVYIHINIRIYIYIYTHRDACDTARPNRVAGRRKDGGQW